MIRTSGVCVCVRLCLCVGRYTEYKCPWVLKVLKHPAGGHKPIGMGARN